ncbi:MAG: HVO_A0114 family putative DNA-binding protein [Gallionella sp.]
MSKKTLHVAVTSLEKDLAQFAQAWHTAETGKRVQSHAGIGFESAVQLLSALTPQRCALIHSLKEYGACSIYALAKHLSRNYSNVHSDVTKLLELGIAEKDASGKMFVPWDEIDVQFPLQKLAA